MSAITNIFGRDGFACIAVCWALMLAAMLATSHSRLSMMIVALLLFAERSSDARPARWRLSLLQLPTLGRDRFTSLVSKDKTL